MRFRSASWFMRKFSAVKLAAFALFFASAPARATFTVEVPSPYGLSLNKVYYAMSSMTTGILDTVSGYRTIDTTAGITVGTNDPSQQIYFDIISTNPGTLSAAGQVY